MTERRRVAIAAVLDVASILIFVALGKREHDGESTHTYAEVVAPFLIGLAAGWLVARAWRAPFALRTGVVVWVVTVVVGLLLRRLAWDDGTAFAFVIVATLFTALCLLGWRAIATRLGPSSAP